MRISIIGSCVTRDVLADVEHPFTEIDYHARTSWVSQASEPWPDPVEIGPALTGKFGERMVREDLAKDVVAKVLEADPDVVVLDLIDERFRVYRFGDSWITWSNYHEETPSLVERLREADECLELVDPLRDILFEVSLEHALGPLLAALPDVPVVLHKAWFVATTRDGEPIYGSAVQHAEKINRALASAYDAVGRVVGDRLAVLEAPASALYADREHRWGLAHMHYVPDYYAALLEPLVALGRQGARRGRTGSPVSPANTASAGSAGSVRRPSMTDRAPSATEVVRLRAEVRRLQAQLADAPDTAAALTRAREELAAARAEVQRVRASASFQIGQLLVGAAKDPRRAAPRLPGELARMWKRRGSPRPAQLAAQAAVAAQRQQPLPATEVEEDPCELLVDRVRWAPVPPGRPVVGLVTGAEAGLAADLAAVAQVVTLVPDRYLAALTAQPDLVLVDPAAARSGPWTGLGTGAAVERDDELADLLTRCGAAGVPTAVLTGEEPTGGLAEVAALADLALGEAGPEPLRAAARAQDPARWLAAVRTAAASTSGTTTGRTEGSTA